ncbi:cytochrome c [Planctomicrobium piriforme]|uniref:Cytochrome C n=1 Tax=Planctomicrobium piriforme TaxID=1576369 RepID=A0A1I3HU98_9PLAN|nr:cytochrome c [Planctomicrobium piriforme]SFI39127.1 Cytochrome C' [Planctomicrobium piriforme]
MRCNDDLASGGSDCRLKTTGRTRLTLCLIGLATGSFAVPAFAQSPVPIESIASIEELTLEVNEQVARLEKGLAMEANYADQKSKGIAQSFGLLACVGQGLAEHANSKDSKINGPALRDAALKFTAKTSTYADAQAALEGVKQVVAGNVTGEHAQLHPWNKLIRMHPMMEEFNGRSSEILKVLKKPRGKPEEISPAVAWGLLSIAMKVDTHEVKNPEDLPKWNAWSDEFRDSTIKLAEAIRAKDKDAGRAAFDKASETCDACHEVFHKE